ncbi:MAG TPA: DUF4412 domain-containing protein [Puia sp.]
MKKLAILAGIFALMTDAYAQFEGTLVYDCTLKTKVMMTVYETKGKVRVEAKSYPMKQGVADILKGKEEDPLLFDFQTNKQMRLVERRHAVVETEFAELGLEKSMKLTEADISVEKAGEETIGKLSCQHFVVKVKGEQRDLWITKDLGSSNICLAGILLYYPTGSMILNKLKSAGGDGVVVKSQTGDQVVNLTNYQMRMPPAYNFEIPAGYTKM